jgi:hypothetical protein
MLCGLAAVLPGQSMSSKNWFVPSTEQSSGGSAASNLFVVTASIGSSVTSAAIAKSNNFAVTSGFTSTLGTATTGQPWLSAVRPLFTVLDGGTKHRVHGTELDLGSSSAVKVNGVTAAVTARQRDSVEVVAPAQKAPGWHRVTLRNSGGTASLSRAMGVLPLIEQARPYFKPGPGGTQLTKTGAVLRYRGQQDDYLVWFFSVKKIPMLPILPFRHGLEVSLLGGAFSVAIGVVNSPDGQMELSLPLVNLGGERIYVQAAAISRKPGYAPGSFTNVLQLN